MKNKDYSGIWMCSLDNFMWAVKVDGKVIGEMHYNQARDYILGKKPREELLVMVGVADDKFPA